MASRLTPAGGTRYLALPRGALVMVPAKSLVDFLLYYKGGDIINVRVSSALE